MYPSYSTITASAILLLSLAPSILAHQPNSYLSDLQTRDILDLDLDADHFLSGRAELYDQDDDLDIMYRRGFEDALSLLARDKNTPPGPGHLQRAKPLVDPSVPPGPGHLQRAKPLVDPSVPPGPGHLQRAQQLVDPGTPAKTRRDIEEDDLDLWW